MQGVLYCATCFHLLVLLMQLGVAVLICKDFLISDRAKELLISLPPLNAKQIYPNLVYLADTKSGFNRTPEQLVTSFAFFPISCTCGLTTGL